MKRLVFLLLMSPPSLWAMQSAPLGVIELGYAVFSGSGCPLSGAIRTLEQKKMLFEIEFDGFFVETGLDMQRGSERKVCNVRIPMEVTPKTQVAVSLIRYTGFNNLEDNVHSVVFAEAYFAGARAPVIQKNFADSGDFRVDLTFSENEKSWSPCNSSSNLKMSIGSEIRGSELELNSTTKIDGRLTFQMEIRPCM